MKKFFLGIVALTCLSSCYCDKITVGKVAPYEKLVHVASDRNFHYLYGLHVSKRPAQASIPGVENFVIKNKQTFGDMLLSTLSFGLVTPTTTKYYVPASNPRVVVGDKKFMSKAYNGYLKIHEDLDHLRDFQ